MTISDIQEKLNQLGFGPVPVIGKYGPKTTAAVRAFQSKHGLVADGIAGPVTMATLFPPAQNKGKYLAVSTKAIDFIIYSEITSEGYYTKKLTRPEYPGLNSGLTIGIGYDLGYNTRQQIAADWGDLVSPNTLTAMLSVAGLKGAAAKAKLDTVRLLISIPFAPAKKVFLERTLPRYAKDTLEIYPAIMACPPDAAGALLSLVFNRGNSLEGSRRVEMKAIAPLVKLQEYLGIAKQILSMRRLWDGVSNDGKEKRLEGLMIRMQKQASLVTGCDRQYKLDEIVYINVA